MNIGILGAGSFGEIHIKVLKDINNFSIRGFYDPDKDISKKISDKYHIKHYPNPDQLIKECDAIDIVSETSSHYQLLEKVIKHKKHIFIEKPICSEEEQVQNIIKKTKHYQPTIQIGHIERYNPAITTRSINFKNIHSIYTRRAGCLNKRNKNTSITLDLMIHDIDLIISNIQSKLVKIEAYSKQEDSIFHSHVECNLLFENGIKANLVASRKHNLENERRMKIVSNTETVELDLLNQTGKKIQKENVQILEFPKNSNPLRDELIDFYKSITEGRKPIVGVEEACAAVNIAIKIDEIIKNNLKCIKC